MTDTSEELWAHALSESQQMKRESRPSFGLAKKRAWKTDFRGRPRKVKVYTQEEVQAFRLVRLWEGLV